MLARMFSNTASTVEKLAKVMQMRASEIGAASPICVSVHANLTDVCRVLSENHLKKVPVLHEGRIVGVINRSDITLYSMKTYLEGREDADLERELKIDERKRAEAAGQQA